MLTAGINQASAGSKSFEVLPDPLGGDLIILIHIGSRPEKLCIPRLLVQSATDGSGFPFPNRAGKPAQAMIKT
jgi:hypothetical protein